MPRTHKERFNSPTGDYDKKKERISKMTPRSRGKQIYDPQSPWNFNDEIEQYDIDQNNNHSNNQSIFSSFNASTFLWLISAVVFGIAFISVGINSIDGNQRLFSIFDTATTNRKLYAEDKQTKTGLIIIDVQRGFIFENLPVFNKRTKSGTDEASLHGILKGKGYNAYYKDNATKYIEEVSQFITEAKNEEWFDFYIYSFDFHPQKHCSFKRHHGHQQISNMKKIKRKNGKGNIYGEKDNGKYPIIYEPKDQKEKQDLQNEENPICEFMNGIQFWWPEHCIQGTPGARLAGNIPFVFPKSGEDDVDKVIGNGVSAKEADFEDVLARSDKKPRAKLQSDKIEYVIKAYKGMNKKVDSYSVFYGFADNKKQHSTGLPEKLNEKYPPSKTKLKLYMLGIAYDVCVGSSAIDAAELGYEVYVIDNLCASITPDKKEVNVSTLFENEAPNPANLLNNMWYRFDYKTKKEESKREQPIQRVTYKTGDLPKHWESISTTWKHV